MYVARMFLLSRIDFDAWLMLLNIMMETAQDTRGLSKGPCKHKETWLWNKEVAEAVREKKKKYGNWKKENSTEAWGSTRRVDEMQIGLFHQQRK